MKLDEILQDIHRMEEDLLLFERKYGVRTETFYAAYQRGEEPDDDAWVLDWSDCWRGNEKRYGYDSQAHPNDPTLASTHPHHKHIPRTSNTTGFPRQGYLSHNPICPS